MSYSASHIQLPPSGQLYVDHVAHYVEEMDQASQDLRNLGFTLTPFSLQSHKTKPNGMLEPAGAGNRCVMLERGYIEFLTPTGTTPIANQLRSGIERYIGIHLVAFGTSAPSKDHSRLIETDFSPLKPVSLQRNIETETAIETAHFIVIRVPHGTMPEGRIQFCHHLTPHFLWQSRWTQHANHAIAISDIIFCVANPQETAARYARYTGLTSITQKNCIRITTNRGSLLFLNPKTFTRWFGVHPPTLPWIAGYIIKTRNQLATLNYLKTAGVPYQTLENERLLVSLPQALGGYLIFEPENSEVIDF
jgi:hypothetical protein